MLASDALLLLTPIANAAPCERREPWTPMRHNRHPTRSRRLRSTVNKRSAQDAPASSPLSERNLAEQRFLLARLRAPVLRRRLDRRTEMRRGVPGPARVVQQGTGQCDQIGVAGFEQLLGMDRIET